MRISTSNISYLFVSLHGKLKDQDNKMNIACHHQHHSPFLSSQKHYLYHPNNSTFPFWSHFALFLKNFFKVFILHCLFFSLPFDTWENHFFGSKDVGLRQQMDVIRPHVPPLSPFGWVGLHTLWSVDPN